MTTCTRCPRCPAEWTSLAAEHCPACHMTFTGTGSGDRHRIGGWGADEDALKHGPRRCRTPDELLALGLVQDPRGFWGTSANLRPDNLARHRAAQASENAQAGERGRSVPEAGSGVPIALRPADGVPAGGLL